MTSAKVVLAGAYGNKNTGDDALMVASLGIINRLCPKNSVVVIAKNNPYVKKLAPNATVLNRIPLAFIGDLLFLGGGTQFFSFPLTRTTLSKKLKYAITSPIVTMNNLKKKFDKCSVNYKKMIGFGLGLGPFVNGSSEEIKAKRILSELDYLMVRDKESLNITKEWGLKNVTMGTDLCFDKELWWDGSKTSQNTQIKRKISVIVRDWPHSVEGASYELPLLNVTDLLIKQRYGVEFVSFCGRYDKHWQSLLHKRKDELFTWDPDTMKFSDFLSKIANSDIIISSRYHGAVLLSTLGKPVICVEVEKKLRLASAIIDESKLLWKQPFAAEQLLSIIENIYNKYEEYQSLIFNNTEKQRIIVRKAINDFYSYIETCGMEE